MANTTRKTHHPTFPFIFSFVLLLISSASSQENTYDFVIIGGGTAGLVVAKRLAENHFSVLVLESGDEPKKSTEIPAYAFAYVVDPEVTFRYASVVQKSAALMDNGRITVISGRTLSGTSNLNLLFYNRGSPMDYDNWRNLTRCASWSYSNMLKYFKRMESYQGEYPSDQHGFHGPLTITRPKYAPGLKFWLEAGQSLGYEIADSNGPQKTSFSAIEFTKKRGRRVNSLDAYITPIRSTNRNLQIATNTNATKIIFKNNRAVGVRFQSTSLVLQNIRPRVVYARKEIILSAGAYGSPLLLLRSGVGPKDSLRKANISVIKDLPVGLNFQDHVIIDLPFIINSDALIMDDERDLNQRNFRVYQTAGDGPYSSSRDTGSQAFIMSSIAKSEDHGDWPDLQLIMQFNKQAYFAWSIVKNDSVASGEGPANGYVVLNRPKSRGSLSLNPKNPDGPPILDVGYLSNSTDIQRLLDGIDLMLKVIEETPAYRRIEARFPSKLNLPGCSGYEFRSRKFWECYIRHVSRSSCHPAGTCRMGRKKSRNAVVDSKLRLQGIPNLRVVDASIMPFIVNTNPQAAVYAIAEKASDMILNEWDWGF